MCISLRRLALVCALMINVTSLSISCAGSDDSDDPSTSSSGKVGATEFVVLDSPNLRFEGLALTGEGKAAAKMPAGELESGRNFAIDFRVEDGGSVSLVTYATSSLSDGVVMTFSRAGRTLAAKLTADGKDLDLSSSFTNVDATASISILVDVHNNEAPVHVVAWTGDIQRPDNSNPVYDSEADAASQGEVGGNGKGTFWGLKLSKATITRAEIGDVKFEEE